MKILNHKTLFSLSILIILAIAGCSKDSTVSDIDKTAALRKVTLVYDSLSYDLMLPAGALDGKSFDELRKQDSSTYANPVNYSITFSGNFTANNTKADAGDAKFDGLTVTIVMDTILSSPIKTMANAFEVKKGTTLPVQLAGSINLATHKKAGLYIFRQIVDGNNLVTSQTPVLNYKIGVLEGAIDLPTIKENIPTRASDEMKAFLRGLLDSDIFKQ